MKLSELLLGVRIKGKMPETEVFGISTDSQSVKKGDLFICIKGGRADGHDYARLALDMGAALVLAERMPSGVEKARVILTEDTRKAASVAWYNFYGRPADGMTKIAVTGTAGKTSVAFILRELLLSSGRRVGVVTTIRAMSGTRTLELGENGGSSVNGVSGAMTTPDPEYFWYAAAEMKKDGCDTVIYEASSQSLLRKAVSAVTPDLCIFTNLSEEHMDAHGTMENYFSTKAGLLEGVKNAVVNVDDEYFSRLPDMFRSCNIIRVSARRENAGKTEVCALRYHSMGENGTEYVYFSEKAVFRVLSRQIGFYSVYNTMEAAAAAIFLGADPMTVQEVLASFDGVDGRMYRVRYRGNEDKQAELLPSVFIDYAHTPKALEYACRALWEIKNSKSDGEHKFIVMFGCGGDRDKTKRPLMAMSAQKYADMTVITNDNPRNEEPEKIISDILTGVDKEKPYKVIPDRRAAIKYAIEYAGAGDIVLLAGKGHEKYEITSRGMEPFDEEMTVNEVFYGLCGNMRE